MLDTRIHHDCGVRRCAAVCQGYHEVTSPPLPPLIKAGAAAEISPPPLTFLEDLSVFQLAQAINLNLSGIVKPSQKSLKEPISDTKESKEAITTAHHTKTTSRKEQLRTKLKLLKKANALRHQIISQQAALSRAHHALHLRQQRTKLYTCHKFKLGLILSGNQPFLDDALAEVAQRRQQQLLADESACHLHLVSSVARLAPDGKYVNIRPVPLPTPLPAPLPPSNRSLWRQARSSSWTPAPMPFKLDSFSATRTRVVHVHHHHYPASVIDSSEGQSEEEAEYMEDDCFGEGAYYKEDFYNVDNYDSDYSGEDELDIAFFTSYDEDSECSSGYDESS